MPREWTQKQERQYSHIRESARKRGESPGRAKEIAARTVNKDRSQRGQTSSSASRTSGGSSGRTKEQLMNEARRLGVDGRSKMNKAQLQRAVAAKKQ